MTGFGQDQKHQFVNNPSEIDLSGDRFLITDIASVGSQFLVTLTDLTNVNEGNQVVFTRGTWDEAVMNINSELNNGKIINTICFNKVLGVYMVLMSQSPSNQFNSKWLNPNDQSSRSEWLQEQYKACRHPNHVFCDPNTGQIVIGANDNVLRVNGCFIVMDID